MSSVRKLWSYQCEWERCGKSFKSSSTFEAHYRRHTNQRSYVCEYESCCEAFHDRGALTRHHRTHVTERPFVCNYESCGHDFHSSEALAQHYLIHADHRPFACKYDSCGQAFHDRGKLIEHHRAHKQRPLACEHGSCSRRFARRETLEAHIHMHARERPFSCTYEGCNKRFCNKGGLIQHEKSHISKVLHPCDHKFCDQALTKPLQFHSHYREEIKKTITSGEVRPTRLRLSQPRKNPPESIVDSQQSQQKPLRIRLRVKETPGGTSTSILTEAHEYCSKSRGFAKRPGNRSERRDIHHDPHPPCPKSRSSPTSKASGKNHVSSHGSKLIPIAVPNDSKPYVCSQAPASQPTTKPAFVGYKDYGLHTEGKSGDHGTPIYTRVCGVYSEEKASPKEHKPNGGSHHCPRCDRQFTRARGVMRHFVGCITKYGNPDCLRWTDHPSLQGTLKFYARNGHQRQGDGLLPRATHVRRNKKESRQLSKGAFLRPLAPKPLSSIVEEDVESAERIYKPHAQISLLQKDVVRPIHKRRDAFRRSNYDPETIARDVLLAMGSHPNMEPLNAHLGILRERFRFVNLESNLSTFRWDLVDPEQGPEQKSGREPEGESEEEAEEDHERQAEQDVDPDQSALEPSEAKGNQRLDGFDDVQWYNDASSSSPSRSSTKLSSLCTEAPFKVILPEKTHLGSMSTIISSAFDCDPSARLMSSNGDLWAAIFIMLERRYDGRNFVIRAAVTQSTGDLIGWVACHEVDTPQADPIDPLTILDWTTAANLMPSQVLSFKARKQTAEEKAERLNQRKVGRGLASAIQVRAVEAQNYLIPVHRMVINALVVHPLHQRRGVASALLNSITKIADEQKRPIWVQAPEDPAVAQGVLKTGLFRRTGFMCAGELNLDLDSYASGCDKGKGVTFGSYKWNYMLRWPQPVVPKTM